jgi:hypothetical protein
MTDYKKDTGSSATMMIRDNGNTVSFMLNSNNGSTFKHELPWGYSVNGATNNDREYDYNAGAGWETLGTWTVTSDQTVTFRIFDTGTSGFGGPTTLSVGIDRSSAPSAPTINSFTSISSTQAVVHTTDGSNNGAAIDSRQLTHHTTNSIPASPIISASTVTTVTGLTPGVRHYFWARTHNAKGYSPWSPVASMVTYKVPDAPDSPIVSDATQTSIVASFTDNGNGGSTITGREIGYGTSPISVQASVSYTGVMTITGLSPGKVYYFFSRVRNSVGWSPYSAPSSLKTVAGASINVAGVWKDAVPYVKDAGVWKLARPWGRVAGEWKQST